MFNAKVKLVRLIISRSVAGSDKKKIIFDKIIQNSNFDQFTYSEVVLALPKTLNFLFCKLKKIRTLELRI